MADPNSGQCVPLNYGYVWATGIKLQSATLQNTGNQNLDYTRIGMYLLGEGEMDGVVEVWDSGLGRLLWVNENNSAFHWHAGCDAGTASAGLTDQSIDGFWSYLPSGIQPLNYHRWCYYTFMLKQLVNDPPNTNQNDPSVWADVNPIGLFRGLRCRTFDSNGTMTGYAFTRNPAWHYVDLLCRRKLFPEYGIDYLAGADDLTAAVRARFLWPVIAESAAYFDQQVDGRPRFSGDYTITQKTTLQALLQQILTCSRSRNLERAGQFAIVADRPRASVFTFSRKNADDVTPTDADLHAAANHYVAKFRDLEIPAFGQIQAIAHADDTNAQVTLDKANPAVAGDYLVIDGTGTNWDGYWECATSSQGIFLTLVNRGNNYPSTVGVGGSIGLRYSRFKSRAPEFRHVQHQLARGAVGAGIPRQRNKVTVETDFSNSTWDQVARISAYQRAMALGPDVTPYVGPPKLALKAPLFAVDASGSGAKAIQIEAGDVVTVDPTLNLTYTGDYEVTRAEIQLTGSDASQDTERTPQAGSISLQLRPYDGVNNYPDTAPASEPGWPTVPGVPGLNVTPTIIPLALGTAAFYVTTGADGEAWQLPEGYTLQNSIAWAAPQGTINALGFMHRVLACDADNTRMLTCKYTDTGAKVWGGDVTYCVLCWTSKASVTVSTVAGNATVAELTLAGGEKVIFAKCGTYDGYQVPLPAGYVGENTLGIASPNVGYNNQSNVAHGFASWIQPNGYAYTRFQDGEDDVWGGTLTAMYVSVLNNGGTWRRRSDGWFTCPLDGSKTLAIGGFTFFDPGLNGRQPDFFGEPNTGDPMLPIIGSGGTPPPLTQMPSTTLQTMVSSNGFDIVDHQAHGLRECRIDEGGVARCSFSDGLGNVWLGSLGTLSLLCDVQTADPGGVAMAVSGTAWPGTPYSTGSSSGGGGGGGGTGAGDPGTGGNSTPGDKSEAVSAPEDSMQGVSTEPTTGPDTKPGEPTTTSGN